MNKTLQLLDPYLYNLINEEKSRQQYGLELIASENFTSQAVFECLGSVLTNKYSEGLPGKRYYGGNEVIDKIESLCIDRALQAFSLSPEEWGVNVQPYSGSIANLAAYCSVLEPQDTIMGLDLPSGGHLTHGYATAKRKISISAIFFNSIPYHINNEGWIDYDELEQNVIQHKPKLIICGASAYPRDWDYKRLRNIADISGAFLLCDMAHTSGLIASKLLISPFEYCDLVTTTTHKTLGGPRSAMIFFKKSLEKKVNFSVFPSIQGGPHENNIAGVATQLLYVMTDEYKEYSNQVIKNAKILGKTLENYGYTLSTGGTDNHLLLINLRPFNITGSKIEALCDLVNISVNKNTVVGDTSALSPGGIRIGTPALTRRGMNEKDFEKVAELLHEAIQLSLKIQEISGRKLKAFKNEMLCFEGVNELRNKVVSFSAKFKFYT